MSAPATTAPAPAVPQATPGPLDPGVLVLAAFALSLYVDVSVGPTTVQELALIGAVGLALLHRGRLVLRLGAAGLPLLLAVVGFVSASVGFGLVPVTRTATLRLALVAAGVAVVAPLLGRPDHLRAFLRVLIILSSLTAAITVLQSFDVLPFLNETPGLLARRQAESTSLYRGSGLVNDPNFQALVLSLGLAAALFVRMSVKVRVVAIGVITLGIVTTFSRMGLLTIGAIGLLWVLLPDPRLTRLRNLGAAATAALIVVSGILLLNDQVDSEIVSGTAARLETTTESLTRFSDLGVAGLEQQEQQTSTEKRIVLLSAGWDTALDNWTIGVGSGWVLFHVHVRTGLGQDPHNSYVAILAAVGLPFGLLIVGLWLRLVGRSIAASLRGTADDRAAAAAMLAAALALFFVNNSHATLFWLPIAMAMRHLPAQQARKRVVA